jgi:hypothetical protein
MKTTLKLKRNPIREYLGLLIYPVQRSIGRSFFLIKSRETIPLSKYKLISVSNDKAALRIEATVNDLCRKGLLVVS